MDQDHVAELAQQWARRRPELETESLQTAARIFRLQRILARAAAARLKELSLSEGEFSVLTALRRAEPPHELTPSELNRSLLLSTGAMTHRLDRLERSGHIVRLPDAADRRRVAVRLTPSGITAVDRAMDAYTETLTKLLLVVDDDDHHQLSQRLQQLLVRLEADGHRG